MSKEIRGVLFDKDGVLIDFRASWDPVIRRVAAELAEGDVALTGKLLRLGGYDEDLTGALPGSVLAAGTPAGIADLWQVHLPGRWTVQTLTARVDLLFDALAPDFVTPLADIAGLFAGLRRRGLRLGVATNDSEANAHAGLTRLCALQHLDFVAGYNSGHGEKPGTGMAEAFCRGTGLAPSDVAMVGDNPHDLEMSRSAGLGLAIGILSGTGDRSTLAPLADHLLDSVSDLEALLDRI